MVIGLPAASALVLGSHDEVQSHPHFLDSCMEPAMPQPFVLGS